MRKLWILIFVLFSCASNEPALLNSGTLDRAYISNGIEQFFHGDLPHWANFSTAGQCQRKTNIRYLHYPNLKKSYDLDYMQMVHLQNMFNRKLYAYKTSTATSEIPLKDESYVFYNVYQQVLGGSYDFIPPKFNDVSVIWIDPFLSQTKKLNKIVRSEKVLEGHPILLSHCLTSYELDELARKLELDDLGVKYLSADMLNIYGGDLKPKYNYLINLSAFLPGKSIKVFSSRESTSIEGNFEFVKVD